MATNGTLVYTSENKSFRYSDGDYTSIGQKVIMDSNFTRLDNGHVYKGENEIAIFNYEVVDGAMTNLLVNFRDASEMTNVVSQINACFAALNA